MRVKTIVFDLDGTLLNTLADLRNSVNYALTSRGYAPRSLEEVRRFIGDGVAKLMERAAPAALDAAEQGELLLQFKEHYRHHYAHDTKAYAGIFETLHRLKRNGYQLGILSNKSQYEVTKLTEQFFGNLPDIAMGGLDTYPPKPHPTGLRLLLEGLKAKRENSVYVGDSEVDVATAHNAGMICFGVTWGFRERKVLEAAKADYIIDKPEEILTLIERFNRGE